MPLPKGQYLVKDFIDITIESTSLIPKQLTIYYKSMQKTFDIDELYNLIDTKVNLDMHCVDGWSVINHEFEGVSLNKITKILNIELYNYIELVSSGGYKSFVYKNDATDSFICLKIDNAILSKERGYPVRFIAPKLYAYKWVKHLHKVSFTDVKPYGYWENRGYSQRARVEIEERFDNNT